MDSEDAFRHACALEAMRTQAPRPLKYTHSSSKLFAFESEVPDRYKTAPASYASDGLDIPSALLALPSLYEFDTVGISLVLPLSPR